MNREISMGDVGTRDDDARNIDLTAVRELFADYSFSDEAWKGFVPDIRGAKEAWVRDKTTQKTFSAKTAAKAAKHMAEARKLIVKLNQSSDFELLAFGFCKNRATDKNPFGAYSRDVEGLMRLEALLTKLGKSKGKRGPDRAPVYFFVFRLCEAYTFLTGNSVTHNPYDGTNNYKSKSVSKSGKIITELVRILAPEIRETQVATVLRSCVTKRRSARKD